MRTVSPYNYYHLDNNAYKSSFKGKTEVYAFTDIHQNANYHCRFVNELMQNSITQDNIILLDNGDIFKGIYPKPSLLQTYSRAKKAVLIWK